MIARLILVSGIVFMLSSAGAFAQWERSAEVIIDGCNFTQKYDTADYTTELTVRRDGSVTDTRRYPGRLGRIEGFDLDNDGVTEVTIEFYSGGAHCCTTLEAYRINDCKLTYLDSIYWGNGGYEIADLDGNGKYEVIGDNDMFAYAFTSYAGSRSFLNIYEFADGKFTNATGRYGQIVRYNIVRLMNDLDASSYEGVDCRGDGKGGDPGEIKSILAAILGSYHSIGETDRGYEIIAGRYPCNDRQEFIEKLKNEFKLK
ncbi:MAG: hypothetical protein K1X85_06115 [Ignavibacteria bacterium]|nr:hypothetical protein [Ignavibacteria bacterium]